jgi:hypothetical protein
VTSFALATNEYILNWAILGRFSLQPKTGIKPVGAENGSKQPETTGRLGSLQGYAQHPYIVLKSEKVSHLPPHLNPYQ